jgi:hypothetical protein
MPLLSELVVDLGVNRTEFLQRLHTSKPPHRAQRGAFRPMAEHLRTQGVRRAGYPIERRAPQFRPDRSLINAATLCH